MAKIRSNYGTDLGLSAGVTIPKGATVEVPSWPELGKNRVIQAWIKAGILTVVDGGATPKPTGDDGKPSDPPTATGTPARTDEANGEAPDAIPVDEQAQLVAALAEYGIKKPANTSIKNLQKALDEAKATR